MLFQQLEAHDNHVLAGLFLLSTAFLEEIGSGYKTTATSANFCAFLMDLVDHPGKSFLRNPHHDRHPKIVVATNKRLPVEYPWTYRRQRIFVIGKPVRK